MKIVAIDLGHYSVKICEILYAFNKWDFVNYYEKKIGDVDLPYPQNALKVVKDLWEQHKITADKTICTVPQEWVTTHYLEMPITSPRKIKENMVPEMEEIVPFNIEEMVYDYQIISKEEGRSSILSNLVRRSVLEKYQAEWSEIGVEPNYMTVDYISFLSLFKLYPDYKNHDVLIVDLGHSNTSSFVISEGKVVASRLLGYGGKNITQGIMKSFECEYTQAEIAKIENPGLAIPNLQEANEEQKKFYQQLEKLIYPIMLHINQTLLGIQANKKITVDKVLITGGASHLRHIKEYMHQKIHIPIEFLETSEYVSQSQIPHMPDKQHFFQKALGMALFFVIKDKVPLINFKKFQIKPGELYQNLQSFLKNDQLILLSKISLVFFAILFFHLIGGISLNKYFENKVLDKTRDAIDKTFPSIQKNFQKKILESSVKLENYLDENLNEQRIKLSLLAEKKELVLDFLYEINQSMIPGKTKLEQLSFSKSQKTLMVNGSIEPDQSTVLKQNLMRITIIENPKFDYDANTKNFNFSANLR